MRIRTVKPEFWRNPDLAKLSEFTRLLALALLNYADDEGYFIADPILMRGELFPFSEDSRSIHGALIELSNIKYVTLYKGTNGRLYGLVTTFKQHQIINRPSPSKLKTYITFTEDSLNTHGGLTEYSLLEQGTGNREKEQGKGAGSAEGCADVSAPTSNLKKEKIVETDEQWLEGLKANQAYQGINIVAEYGKMVAWCGVNKKQATKRRFINWLNRAEKPLSFAQVGQTASSQYQRSHKVHEPANWREVLRINYPDNVFSNDTRDFQSMSASQQQSIVDAFNRVPPNERRSA